MGKRIDITDKRFGRLLVIKYAYTKGNRAYWECKCDCGNSTIVSGKLLRSGQTKSCGCLNIDKLKERRFKHGMRGTKFYRTYSNILTRCTNPNSDRYKNYGGRGIKCLWKNFNDFYEDMYQSYLDHVNKFGESDTTIDRINTDGNYCKENCRWATNIEQANNKTTNHFIEVDGEDMTLAQAAEKYDINYQTLASRLTRGMDIFGYKK